jgi:hypothetical protein
MRQVTQALDLQKPIAFRTLTPNPGASIPTRINICFVEPSEGSVTSCPLP